jgi:hypothetical protein
VFTVFGNKGQYLVPYQKQYFATAINGDLSPTALDQLQIFGGDTITRKDDTLYWFYTGNGQATVNGSLWDVDLIFFATKDVNDGLPIYEGWARYNGGSGDALPVISNEGTGWEEEQVFGRTCFWDADDNLFKMWYGGQSARGSSIFRIGYATSPDGITWTKSGSNPIYENQTLFGIYTLMFAVYKESPTLYHAVSCGDRNVDTVGGVYLTSADGISWTQQAVDVLKGETATFVQKIEKVGNAFYLYCEDAPRNTYFANIGTTVTVYSTTDWISYTKVRTILSATQPQEAAMSLSGIINIGSKYYLGYNYSKNQVKSPLFGNEPYTAMRFIESDTPHYQTNTNEVNYPSNLKRYYPCYQADEQNPLERINGDLATVTGTLSWNDLKYCGFYGSQEIQYPTYTPSDPSKFAVKARVGIVLTGTHHIIKQHETGQNGWEMYLNLGKLTVGLFNSSGTLAKLYETTSQVSKPPGVYDDDDYVSVGFIFNSGTLELLFGDGIQPVTKTNDLTLNEIEFNGAPTKIGVGGAVNNMRSMCIFDEITEDQWLNVIDL